MFFHDSFNDDIYQMRLNSSVTCNMLMYRTFIGTPNNDTCKNTRAMCFFNQVLLYVHSLTSLLTVGIIACFRIHFVLISAFISMLFAFICINTSKRKTCIKMHTLIEANCYWFLASCFIYTSCNSESSLQRHRTVFFFT